LHRTHCDVSFPVILADISGSEAFSELVLVYLLGLLVAPLKANAAAMKDGCTAKELYIHRNTKCPCRAPEIPVEPTLLLLKAYTWSGPSSLTSTVLQELKAADERSSKSVTLRQEPSM